MNKTILLIVIAALSAFSSQARTLHQLDPDNPYYVSASFFTEYINYACEVLSEVDFKADSLHAFVKKYDLLYSYGHGDTSQVAEYILTRPSEFVKRACSLRDSLPLMFENDPYSFDSSEEPDTSMLHKSPVLISMSLNLLMKCAANYHVYSQLLSFDPLSFDKSRLMSSPHTLFLDQSIMNTLIPDTAYQEKIAQMAKGEMKFSDTEKYSLIVDQLRCLFRDSEFVSRMSEDPMLALLFFPYAASPSRESLEHISSLNYFDSLTSADSLFFNLDRRAVISGKEYGNRVLKHHFSMLSSWMRRFKDSVESNKYTVFTQKQVEETRNALQSAMSAYKSSEMRMGYMQKTVEEFIRMLERRTLGSVKVVRFAEIKTDEVIDSAQGENPEGCTYYGNMGNVISVAHDNENLWAGTDRGLVRIDGLGRRNVYNRCNSDLPYNVVLSLTVQKEKLWVGTRHKGVCSFDGENWDVMNADSLDTYSLGGVKLLSSGSGDVVWAGRWDGGLLKIDGDDTVSFTEKNSPFPQYKADALAAGHDGTVWMGVRNGIGSFDGEEWRFVDSSEFKGLRGYVEAMAIDSSGNVWFSADSLIFCYDGTEWEKYEYPCFRERRTAITCMAVDFQNRIWVGTRKGLYSYNSESWALYPEFEKYGINDIGFCDSGNTWIATGRGLFSIDSTQTVCTRVGLSSREFPGEPQCMGVDRDGNFTMIDSDGIAAYINGRWELSPITETNSDNQKQYHRSPSHYGYARQILWDRDSTLWIVSGDSGVFRYDSSGLSYFEYPGKRGFDEIKRMAVDSSDNLWFANYGGLLHCNKDSCAVVKVGKNGSDFGEIRSLQVDGTGKLWVGTRKGIGVYDEGDWVRYDSLNSKLPINDAWPLAFRNGVVWIAAERSGLVSFDGKKWKAYDVWNSGLLSNTVFSVNFDRDGNLWAATDYGLSRFDGKEWYSYNSANTSMSGSYVNNFVISSSDNIWIYTHSGGLMRERRESFIKKGALDSPDPRPEESPDHWYLKSLFTGDPVLAMKYINKAIRMDKSKGEYYSRRAEVYAATKKYKKAIKDANRAIKSGVQDDELYFTRGVSFHVQNMFRKAYDDYTAAIALDSNDAKTYANRADCSRRFENYAQAVRDYSQALRFAEDKDSTNFLVLRAEMYMVLDSLKKAEQDIDRAFSRGDARLASLTTRAALRLKKEEYDSAICDYSEALKMDSTLLGAYNNRGYAYFKKGVMQKAFEDFTEALAIDSDDVNTLINRGGALAELEKYDEALEDLNKAVRLEKKSVSALTNRGIVYSKKGKLKRAYKDFRKAYAIDSTNTDLINSMGITLIKQKKFDDAIEMLNKAVKLDESCGDVYYNIACAYSNKKQPDLCIKFLRKAFENGYDDFEHLRGDDDFDFVRESREYKALIDEFDKDD
ncbi:MAG: tetratricopeptide repeat protein [Chitinispirillaceae bacterium]